MDSNKLSEKYIKEIEKIVDPETRLIESKKKKIYTELDTVGVSSDILPYGQKWAVVSFIRSDPTLNELFYSFAFDHFVKQGRSSIRKIILGGDRIIDKKLFKIIYNDTLDFKMKEERMRKNAKKEYMKMTKEEDEDFIKRIKEYEKGENVEQKKKLLKDRLELKRKRYKDDLNEDRLKRESMFYEKLHKKVDSIKTIKHEKDTEYIVSYFREFKNKNRKELDSLFRKKYGKDYDMYSLVKIHGVFKKLRDAQDFAKKNSNELKFGNTFIQPMGKWNISNPPKAIIENTEFMNKKTGEIIDGYKENRRKARDQFKFRKEVLKEYAAQEQGLESYKSYSRSKNEVGTHKVVDKLGRVRDGPSKIKPVKPEDEILREKIPENVLERSFEFFNQKDRFQLKMMGNRDKKNINMAMELAKSVIKTEIDTDKASSYINPDIMRKLKMDTALIEHVENKNKERKRMEREAKVEEDIRRKALMEKSHDEKDEKFKEIKNHLKELRDKRKEKK